MKQMITRVVECEAILDKINNMITQREIWGWQLKGTPFNFKKGKCWLAFETESSSELSDDISKNVE